MTSIFICTIVGNNICVLQLTQYCYFLTKWFQTLSINITQFNLFDCQNTSSLFVHTLVHSTKRATSYEFTLLPLYFRMYLLHNLFCGFIWIRIISIRIVIYYCFRFIEWQWARILLLIHFTIASTKILA